MAKNIKQKYTRKDGSQVIYEYPPRPVGSQINIFLGTDSCKMLREYLRSRGIDNISKYIRVLIEEDMLKHGWSIKTGKLP